MRLKLKPIPEDGDERVKKKFLWLPKKVNREVRWLEHANWQERYYYSWKPINWIDEE